MDKKTIISNLLTSRNALYSEQTVKIYEHLSTIIEGVCLYLSKFSENNMHVGKIYWEDVSLKNDNLLMLGMIKYPEKSVILIDGEEIEITKDNADHFEKLVRVGIPADMLKYDDAYEIVQYLDTIYRMPEDEYTGSEEDNVIEDESFDLEGLTEEQKITYNLLNKKGTLN